MKKNCARLLALLIVLSVILSLLPTVFSEEAAETDATYAADRLWKQIDALRGTVAKRGASAGEAAFAALSDSVYALVEASGTAEPDTLAANGDFIRWVDSETGVPCCYSPDHEAVKSGASALTQTELAQEVLRDAVPTRTAASANCPQSLNVGLLQPYWESSEHYGATGFLRYSPIFLQQANLLAEKTGGSLIRFAMSGVTPDTIAYTLQSCGIVLINSHGSTDYRSESDRTTRANSSYLWLTSDAGSIAAIKALLHPEDYTATHTGPFGTYYDVYFSGGEYCVNGTVIANHMTADAPGSLVYFGCCLGMATDGLFAPLRQKGVEAAIGFSQTVTFKGDHDYMLAFTESLLSGGSIEGAMAAAKQKVGLVDPYKLSNPCYPIVVSSADPYPGRGNVDAPQTVVSTWHLSTRCVTFSVPSTVSPLAPVYCGSVDSVIMPAAEDVEGYTFVGWSTTPIGNETTEPFLYFEDDAYVPRNNTTLYAVYTCKEAHSGGYIKVTASSVFHGDYLLVYESGGLVFNASASELNAKQNYISAAIENHQIAYSAAVEAAAVTIRRVTGTSYYSIQLPNGKYFGNLGSSSGFNVTQSLTETHANYITFNTQDQTVTIRNTAENYTLLFHSGVSHNRFSYYLEDPTDGNQHAICLYRKDSNALVDVYTSAPNTACAHEAWSTAITAPTCLRSGSTRNTCAYCGATWTTNVIDALGHWLDKGVVTLPSDGSFGYTTYTCRRADCGYSYQTDFNGLDYEVTLNVLGTNRQLLTINSYDGAMLPNPEDTVDGCVFAGWSETPILSESVTAELITDLYYPMADSTVYAVYSRCVDDVVFYSTAQSALKIYSASLILNGRIDLAFAAQLPAGYSNPRMVVNGTQINEYSSADGRYVFVYSGINPQCIGDSLTATLFASNGGTEESVSLENYSVRQYCVNKLADGAISDRLRTLLSDLLAYGEAAQIYTNYRTDRLITDGDDISDPMYSLLLYLTGYTVRFDGGEPDPATRWVNAGLTLTNSVSMTFRFIAEDTEGLTVTVGVNGRTRAYSTFDAVSGAANTYEISFEGISAHEFGDDVSASFARNGTPIGNTLHYSVNAYVQSNMNKSNANLSLLVTALYNYGAAAKAYVTGT